MRIILQFPRLPTLTAAVLRFTFQPRGASRPLLVCDLVEILHLV